MHLYGNIFTSFDLCMMKEWKAPGWAGKVSTAQRSWALELKSFHFKIVCFEYLCQMGRKMNEY